MLNKQNFMMGLKAKYLIAAIFLLILAFSNGNTDFKTKFGEELGITLKKSYAELIQSNLDHLSEFYNTLLHDMKPTEKEQRAFKLRLETIKEMKQRVGSTITEETIKMSKDFARIVLWEIVLFQGTSEIKQNEEKLIIIRNDLKICAEKEQEDLKKFQQKIYQKWLEMYEKIPAEELQRHSEYDEINDYFEKSVSKDNMGDVKGVGNADQGMLEMLKKLTDFFDYKEYKFLFEKQQA